MRDGKQNVIRWGGLALFLLFLAFAAGARADDQGQPGRAVRLSSVDGQVQILQAGQTLTEQAVANTPLFEGMQLVTKGDGRAEVQFEDGTLARITPDSSMTLSMLKPNGESEIQLNYGLGYFELQSGSQGQPMRVRFGNTLVTGSGSTVLRVNMDQAPGELAVFSGNAHVDGADGVMSLDLQGGESLKLNASNPAASDVAESIEPDSWDAWNTDRDQALAVTDAGAAAPEQSGQDQNNPAWGDLSANGSWYNVPDQGYVWSPYEASNPEWDPYGTGYWMSTPSYGYMWVSGEPWGYLPYQCGMWNYYDSFGWGWAPGGCRPWWGGSGWVINIGVAPGWYQRPSRPLRTGPPYRPLNPRPGRPHPFSHGPMIAVNRHETGGNGYLPSRNGDAPVTIGSSVVQPLRPIVQRPGFTGVQPPRIQPLIPHDTSHLQVQRIQPLIPQDNSHLEVQRIQPLIPHNTFTSRPGYVRPPAMPNAGAWQGNRQGYWPVPSQSNRVAPFQQRPMVQPHSGNFGARPMEAPAAPRPAPVIHAAPAPRAAPAPAGHK